MKLAEINMQSGFKEEASSVDFAVKVAERMMSLFHAAAEQEAPGAVKFELNQLTNGVPYVRVAFADNSPVTRTAVNHIILDICKRELPDGNLLQIKPVFGGLDMVTISSFLIGFRPV